MMHCGGMPTIKSGKRFTAGEKKWTPKSRIDPAGKKTPGFASPFAGSLELFIASDCHPADDFKKLALSEGLEFTSFQLGSHF